MNVLVTGSSGLIGSEAVRFFCALGFRVAGADNNGRREFFGEAGDTSANLRRLQQECPRFAPHHVDIRHRSVVDQLVRDLRPELVIHAAAQPSHDLSARRPLDDFDVNALGTLNLLEACRRHARQAVFILVSTNKVYGDGPNRLALAEHPRRYDFADPRFEHGISEDFPIDRALHSPFGASKLAADVMTQEYGRYYGLQTGVFRCGCITGAAQAGVELHGFLNYLAAAAARGGPYTIYGYQGKQVRDQLHSRDLASAFWCFAQAPRPGEVYNLGGGRQNSASILECLDVIERVCGRRPQVRYCGQHRLGDHICYYSDTRKFQRDYPRWSITLSLAAIIEEMLQKRPVGSFGGLNPASPT